MFWGAINVIKHWVTSRSSKLENENYISKLNITSRYFCCTPHRTGIQHIQIQSWNICNIDFQDIPHCNYECLILHFNMSLALQAIHCLTGFQYLHRVNKQCWHCQAKQVWTVVRVFTPMQTRQELSQINRTWIWLRLMGSWPHCPIEWQELNASLEEVLRSYPVWVPWHPQEASMEWSSAKSTAQ